MDKIIQEMEKRFGKFYYLRSDLRIKKENLNLSSVKQIKTILGKKVLQLKDFDGFKLILEDESWLMFRKSGTEKLLRLYAEADSYKKAKALLSFGEKFLNKS